MDQNSPQELLSSEQEEPTSLADEGGPLVEFLKKFEMIEVREEKLRSAIDFMRSSLSQSGSPYFKGFWEVRKLSLPLFKEGLSTPLRATLWDEYVELTREGRRLKNLSDEESAFAAEQIEIAIKSLEVEVEGFHHYAEEVLSKIPDIEMPQAKSLEGKRSYYLNLQRRLNLLNAYASHIHALRKELIKTEMRVRNKNKFFERLSVMGDRIFPVRKELIREVSLSFTAEIDQFVEEHFSEKNFSYENVRKYVFFYREEIKALQACAKVITLNTTAFTKTREELSKCWDRLKGMEKELKKEYVATKQKSSENSLAVQEKIKEIETSFQEGKCDSDAVLCKLDELSKWMRQIDLTHHDVKMLKEALKEARALPEAKKVEEEELKKRKILEIEVKRKELLEEFKASLARVKERFSELSVEQLTQELQGLKNAFSEITAPKHEKQLLERSLKELRDLIEDKREDTLLNLSDESKAALDDLKEMLQKRKQRRAEIKSQIEEYRCVIGGSSLDFEKAIEFGELMAQEKERLEKIDESIKEIEEKILYVKKKA